MLFGAGGYGPMNEGGHVTTSGQALENCGKPAEPPIDLAHLDRQTMGDAALQAEVLGLLDDQLTTVLSTIGDASPEERAALAHGLKGAARGVGAFALAEGADAVERAPDLDDSLRRLDELAQAVLRFIARRRNGTHND